MFPFLLLADDDSDSSPHDMEGNSSDLEAGFADMNGVSLNNYGGVTSSAYSQMQVSVFGKNLWNIFLYINDIYTCVCVQT